MAVDKGRRPNAIAAAKACSEATEFLSVMYIANWRGRVIRTKAVKPGGRLPPEPWGLITRLRYLPGIFLVSPWEHLRPGTQSDQAPAGGQRTADGGRDEG
jgi:hypothetical protein